MRKIIILLLFLTPLTGKSQLLDSEELYNKVVLLIDINGKTANSGTGFLVTANDQYFLVTAKHVADSLRIETTEIFFRDSNKKAIPFKLYEFLKKPIVSGFNDNSDFFILKLETTDAKKLEILKKSSLDFSVLQMTENQLIEIWMYW